MGPDSFHVSKFIPDHRKKALSRILGKNSSSYKYALEGIKQYTFPNCIIYPYYIRSKMK